MRIERRFDLLILREALGLHNQVKNEELSQVRVTAGRKFKPSHSEQ